MDTTIDQTDNTYFENWSNQELVEVSHFMSHYYNDCSFKDFATRHEVLLAFNIRSIPQNLDSFIDEYHEVMKTNLSIICFTETWYKDHNIDIYNLYNYSGTHVYRTVKMGGGVSIFVKKTD